MAIFAQKTAFRSSAFIPEIKIVGGSSTPANQQILIWSDTLQAFANGDLSCILTAAIAAVNGGSAGTVTNGNNLGTGAQLFKDLDPSFATMNFRSIAAGPGIVVGQDTLVLDEIAISNSILIDAEISVPDSFQLVIDNDDTTTSSAIFELMTNNKVIDITLTPVTFAAAALDIEIITDPAFILPGQIKTTLGDFIALGFEAGMCLEIIGTTEQDGVFVIDTVTVDTITITISFPDATDAGLQPATTLNGLHFNITDSQNLQLLGSDLAALGFLAGQTLTFAGTTDNDGTFTIDVIAADIITIIETFPGTLGCDVNTITITTPALDISTGWFVNELGEMTANDTTINGDLTVTGTATFGGQTIEQLAAVGLPSFPENGLITQTTSGVFVGRSIIGGAGITVTNADGIAGDPTIDADDFILTLGGDLTGNTTIMGLTDATLTATLATIPALAMLAGQSFNRVTIDGSGRVTDAENLPILGGPGIIVTNGDGVLSNPLISPRDFTISISGDVVGSGNVVDLNNVDINVDLPQFRVNPETFNNVTVDAQGRVTSGSLVALDFQPLDADLTNLADGFLNPGLVIWDGTGYIQREIDGTAQQVIVTDSDGVAGNITIGFADNPIFAGNGSITIPLGTDAQQPVTPTSGMIRFNTDSVTFEGYDGTQWEDFAQGLLDFLPLTGGTLTGDLAMGTNNITIDGLVDGRDVSADGVILDAINTGLGVKVQTAPDTFENRTIVAETQQGITVSDGDGVAADPTLGFDANNFVQQFTDPHHLDDKVVFFDASSGETKVAAVGKINRREAFSYFMAQL